MSATGLPPSANPSPADRTSGDGEHDAWHQALRHAPDASATPPKALRDAILAEAAIGRRERGLAARVYAASRGGPLTSSRLPPSWRSGRGWRVPKSPRASPA